MYSNMPSILKIAHIIPLSIVYCIIYLVVYSTTKYYVLANFSMFNILVSSLFYFTTVMTIINHILSFIVDPGKVDFKWVNDDHQIERKYEDKNDLFCLKCNMPRPKRAHHCSVCNTCILKMDHHCPWIGNCVGYYNQKYFYLFLFYALLGNLICVLCLSPLALKVNLYSLNLGLTQNPEYNNNSMDIMKNNNNDSIYYFNQTLLENEIDDAKIFRRLTLNDTNSDTINIYDSKLLVISTMVSLVMTLTLTFLFIIQTSLIINNLTNIESLKYNNTNNPYNSSNKLMNLSIVLGMNSRWEWFLPTFKPNIYNNGYSFISTSIENHDYYHVILEENQKNQHE